MSIRLFACFALGAVLSVWASGGVAPELTKSRELLRNLPIRFQPNAGQWNRQVKFAAQTSGSTLLLTARDARFSAGGHTVSISLPHSNPAPRVEGMDPLATRANYFIGQDRSRWSTAVPQYARVRYPDIYPGIDLIYYGNSSSLEYDLVLRPGADPGRIRLKFRGAGRVTLNSSGDLLLDGDGRLVQKKPVIYQETAAGARRQIEGRYRLLGSNLVAVELGAYDRSRPLTIDPVVVYSSLLGGGGSDSVIGVKTDKAGNIWVAGYTATGDLQPVGDSYQPASGGGTNIFIAGFNPQGDSSNSLRYFTYIGGSGVDMPNAMAMDANGVIYLTGSTTSTDFPLGGFAFENGLTSGSGTDAFVIKFDPSQSGKAQMIYSSYLGGSGTDIGYGIDFDAAGFVYIIGTTLSQDFPVTGSAYARVLYGPQDAFIAKFDLTASSTSSTLAYATFLGGELDDDGRAIAVTPSGTVYIAGSTESTGFPQAGNQYRSSLNGFLNGWVAQMDLTKTGTDTLVYSTYLGGGVVDEIRRIALDPAGKLLVTGYTTSPDFPITATAYQMTLNGNADAFVARVDPSAPPNQFLLYSTFLGGANGDVAYAITGDSAGKIYVTGYTLSRDFPVQGNPVLATWGGGTEIFISRLNPAISGIGGLEYSTFLGQTGQHVGYGINVAKDGTVSVGGYTAFQDIYVSPNAIQQSYGGGLSDAFLFVLGP